MYGQLLIEFFWRANSIRETFARVGINLEVILRAIAFLTAAGSRPDVSLSLSLSLVNFCRDCTIDLNASPRCNVYRSNFTRGLVNSTFEIKLEIRRR